LVIATQQLASYNANLQATGRTDSRRQTQPLKRCLAIRVAY